MTGTRMTISQKATVFERRAQLNFGGGGGKRSAIQLPGIVGRYLLCQTRHKRQMAKVFGMVQTVPDEELVGGTEAQEPGLLRQDFPGESLVQQGADFEASRLARLE